MKRKTMTTETTTERLNKNTKKPENTGGNQLVDSLKGKTKVCI